MTLQSQSEAGGPGPKDLHESVIETGRTEDLASSVSIAKSSTLNLVENRFENLHGQGETALNLSLHDFMF